MRLTPSTWTRSAAIWVSNRASCCNEGRCASVVGGVRAGGERGGDPVARRIGMGRVRHIAVRAGCGWYRRPAEAAVRRVSRSVWAAPCRAVGGVVHGAGDLGKRRCAGCQASRVANGGRWPAGRRPSRVRVRQPARPQRQMPGLGGRAGQVVPGVGHHVVPLASRPGP